MKKQSAFLSAALMATAITLTVFCAAGCSSDDDSGGGTPSGITVLKVGNLPEFPATASPATDGNVGSILAMLAQSRVTRSINSSINEVISDYRYSDDDYSYKFTDLENDDQTVKVSASRKKSEKTSSQYFENYGGAYYLGEMFKTSDYYRGSSESKRKGQVTKNITSGNVTIVAGSKIESLNSYSRDISVTKAGLLMEAQGKINGSGKEQGICGFTVVTSAGSIKVILDQTYTRSISASNLSLYEILAEEGRFNEHIVGKYSGSLKIYGKNNALLKTVTVNSFETLKEVQKMVGLRGSDYDYDDNGEGDDKKPNRSIAPLIRTIPKL
jgi:hypothetical protein